MVDVVVLVRRFFDNLLYRLHRRVDDRSSDTIVMKHVAAIAYRDVVFVGGFRILDDHADVAFQCTASQRLTEHFIVLFLLQLRRITLPSLVAVVSCRIRLDCLAWCATSRADDRQLPPLDFLRCRSRWYRLRKIVRYFSRRDALMTALTLAESTAAAANPSWRV